jgi:tRNA A-37 threonylcarbamoyl transferase component Bud32
MTIDSLIGKQIGNYRIERVLGRGGMATVYFGHDTGLNRPVAIKVIDERYRGNAVYQERFMREAGMIAALRHPNILEVYYAGEEDDLFYFVLEYIPGKDLCKLLQEQKSSGGLLLLHEVLRIGGAVADALDYAHRQGVIHRDVKPSNVIITQDGRVVLTDFGLAMDVSRGTMGEVFGSPHYISPEQARSSAQAVPQSDLYSLGVMLYEMLTGSVPFTDSSAASLAVQHISQAPPSPRAINPALPLAADAVLLKALSKQPADRYRTGLALMRALTSALDAGVPATQPVSPAPARAKPARRVAATQPPLPARPVPVRPDPLPTQAASTLPAGSPRQPTSTVGRAPRAAVRTTRRGIGCGLLVALLVVAGTLGIFSAGRALGLWDPFSSAATGVQPGQTQTAPAAWLTATSTPSPETALPILDPPTRTPTGTPSATATRTETPTPSASPTPITQSLQFNLPRKTESMVIINQGEGILALKNLLIKGTSSRIQGDDWDSIFLKKGQCVFILASSKDAGRMGSQSCKQAHSPLVRSSDHPFWMSRFDVLYPGEPVGTCSGLSEHNSCTLHFAFSATETPLPQESPTEDNTQ